MFCLCQIALPVDGEIPYTKFILYLEELHLRTLLTLLGILLGLMVLAACQSSTANPPPGSFNSAPARPTVPPLPELDPAQVILGETVYAQNCAKCHGENLEGEADWKIQNEDGSFRAPPHTAEGHTWHHSDQQLLEAIELGGARFEEVNVGGTSNMPAFAETLTDEEITAVLAYIKSQWPEDIRASQWQVTVQTANQ